MDLIKKTNTHHIIFLLLMFPVLVVTKYFIVQYFLDSRAEEILLDEAERITSQLDNNEKTPPSDYLYEYSEVDTGNELNSKLTDTIFYDEPGKEQLSYKVYTFYSETSPQPVQITLRYRQLETAKLIWLLILSSGLVILLLAIGLYFINRRLYRSAWSPFFSSLSRLKQYDFSGEEPIQLNVSRINEFEELNQVITSLIEQVRKDFRNLKEFNENISHEVQTPLAIIRNKMVLLMESSNLNEKELQQIQAVYQETNKLSKIGKTLTLLSRIENQEFRRLEPVDVKAVISNILSNMEEIISFKNLEVSAELQPVTIECDHIIADILFTNLIKNAVQHNLEGGWIKMRLNEHGLKISNTGAASDVSTEKLFNRFQKGSSATDTLGLGLAINQKICEIYGFQLDYDREGETHTFSLYFSQQTGEIDRKN